MVFALYTHHPSRRIQTYLDNTLYLISLWSDLSCAAELVIADSKLVLCLLRPYFEARGRGCWCAWRPARGASLCWEGWAGHSGGQWGPGRPANSLLTSTPSPPSSGKTSPDLHFIIRSLSCFSCSSCSSWQTKEIQRSCKTPVLCAASVNNVNHIKLSNNQQDEQICVSII